MDKAMKARRRKEAEHRAAVRDDLIVIPAVQESPCANGCATPLTAADNLTGGLITLSVNGRATSAHRECPPAGMGA